MTKTELEAHIDRLTRALDTQQETTDRLLDRTTDRLEVVVTHQIEAITQIRAALVRQQQAIDALVQWMEDHIADAKTEAERVQTLTTTT